MLYSFYTFTDKSGAELNLKGQYNNANNRIS